MTLGLAVACGPNTVQLRSKVGNCDGSSIDVVRIPMPSNSGQNTWRTYANSLFVNGVNLVPVYSDDTSKEAAALAVCLHGAAADIAAEKGQRGLLATDLFGPMRELLQ